MLKIFPPPLGVLRIEFKTRDMDEKANVLTSRLLSSFQKVPLGVWVRWGSPSAPCTLTSFMRPSLSATLCWDGLLPSLFLDNSESP